MDFKPTDEQQLVRNVVSDFARNEIGMGGAMDLVAGAKTVYVLTEHCAKDGPPKLVRRCTLPLTGAAECDVIITERGLFRFYQDRGFVLEEVACGHTEDEIFACTEMRYQVADDLQLDAYRPPRDLGSS